MQLPDQMWKIDGQSVIWGRMDNGWVFREDASGVAAGKARHFERGVWGGGGKRMFCEQTIGCILEHCHHECFAKWVRVHEACHDRIAAHLYWDSGSSRQPARRAAFSHSPCVSTMTTKSQQPKGPDGALSSLNKAIEAVELAKVDSRITQAKAVFGSVIILLVLIRVGLLFVSADQPLANLVHRPQRPTKWTTSTSG